MQFHSCNSPSNVVCQKMWYSLVIIFIFVQCGQGVVRHFNSKRHSEYIEYSFRRPGRPGVSDNDIQFDEIPQLRARRQGPFGEPISTSAFLQDGRSSARVIYSGEGSKVIYVLTYENSRFTSSSALYRSDDYGQTFMNQESKLRAGFRLDPNIYRFSSDNRLVIFADNVRFIIYVTTDEGRTFTSRTVPVDPRTLKPHPTMAGWILGYNPSQGGLMYSNNSGASWDFVAPDVHPPRLSNEYTSDNFVWGEPGIDWNVDNPSQQDLSKVFYNVYTDGSSISGNDRMFYVASNSGSGYTSKLFDRNLGHFDSFILDGSYIFAGQYNSSSRSTRLHVSYMRNLFNLARIPTVIEHYGYLVGSYRSSQALVVIDHDSHHSLYLSDETGTYYTLSLEDIVRDNGLTDLEIINSVNGAIIANQIDAEAGPTTVISFDNGARWSRIPSPATDVDGLPISCTLPQCSLNFLMDTSVQYRRSGVYSRSSAPGIIVAHGSFGDSVPDDDVSVFISRDGGLTWNQTLDSSWDVEIIDHGGLLVAARDHNQNDSMMIRYSCDEGINWYNFSFTDAPVTVWGVITEPGLTTTQVLLFGMGDSNPNWMITHVNFTSIFSRVCQPSDYYQWSVSSECLLGEIRIIERRKPEVCCWNSRQYERVISTTPCECTAADFECEWGYIRSSSTEDCVLDTQYGPRLDCLTGYRKIPGDVCEGGVSERFLPPSGCVTLVTMTPVTMTSVTMTPVTTVVPVVVKTFMGTVTSVPGNDHNDNISSSASPGGSTGDDHNTAAVAASVTVILLLTALSIIIIVILGIAYFIRKRRRIASTSQQPNDLVTMSNEKVVGGDMKFKKLIEDE